MALAVDEEPSLSLSSPHEHRENFFEAARLQAQRDFEKDKKNAQALVRWGGALLELAHYKSGRESTDMIKQAIVKLQQSLEIDPSRADAEWCLGNAFTSMKCSIQDPSNETYKKAIEMCEKAPEYYDEIQAHIQAQIMGDMTGGAAAKVLPSPADFWYDVGGWVVLGAVLVGTMFLARASAKSS
ncbi:translocase of outer mitochondrial membrane [Dunaliella salina]|uniref:Translocase of outer mitochondrial membrane n=1 Tax=Dunaliella salina TaxID=3046 RepID=A0ABQ7G5C7_DUNSA|nr:translocase of outer mitochondrial membrane [Dunaliella salina]|eukprot:KAF5829818.1 translocase of outer mitochondrial membrane [Dunaliella salina]